MVKTEQHIRYMIAELENSDTPLDEYMRGYLNALKWVLNDIPFGSKSIELVETVSNP